MLALLKAMVLLGLLQLPHCLVSGVVRIVAAATPRPVTLLDLLRLPHGQIIGVLRLTVVTTVYTVIWVNISTMLMKVESDMCVCPGLLG